MWAPMPPGTYEVELQTVVLVLSTCYQTTPYSPHTLPPTSRSPAFTLLSPWPLYRETQLRQETAQQPGDEPVAGQPRRQAGAVLRHPHEAGEQARHHPWLLVPGLQEVGRPVLSSRSILTRPSTVSASTSAWSMSNLSSSSRAGRAAWRPAPGRAGTPPGRSAERTDRPRQPPRPARYSVQRSVQYSVHCTAQCTVHSTGVFHTGPPLEQYNTVQYSTVQYSTGDFHTVVHPAVGHCPLSLLPGRGQSALTFRPAACRPHRYRYGLS